MSLCAQKENAPENFLDALSFVGGELDAVVYLYDPETEGLRFAGNMEGVGLPAALAEAGCSVDALAEHLGQRQAAQFRQDLQDLLSGEKKVCRNAFRLTAPNGKRLLMKSSCRLQEGDRRQILGYLSCTDAGQRLDDLSGLPNAAQFSRDMSARLARNAQGFLMLLDIDNFKDFNTKYGRGYGNHFISTAAQLLEETLGDCCALYRMEGDKFAVCPTAEECPMPEALFRRVQERFVHICTFSSGVAAYTAEEKLDTDTLYQRAENALYQAKIQGKNAQRFFSAADYEKQRDILQLQDELRNSVAKGCEGFALHYQPQIACADYGLFGVEALLRYRSPRRGLVRPDEFIPILESTGLIWEVGLWVLETALRQCSLWREHLPQLHMSVNVSYIQLKQADITEHILRLLKQLQLPGEALTLEITESAQLQDHRYFNKLFYKLQHYGIKIAIDDFGTGYSSLSYLKLLSIDEVKIDRCFVSCIQHSAYNYRLLSNMIELAHSAQIRVCCEGLETEQELLVLKELHPDLIQGYLFAKPCDEEQFESCFIRRTSEEYIRREQRREYYRTLAEQSGGRGMEESDQQRLSTIVDSMEELVYVRDLDTSELLYMNAAGREMTGVYDYKGKKCYQVLEGRTSPCENCAAGTLNTEGYCVRERHNLCLGRHFMLKEKLISWQNRPAGLTVAIDLTEKEIMSQSVREKLEFERNIVDCTKMLLEETDIHTAVNGVLRSIGTFYMADRAYLFELQDNKQFWDNTCEWCAEGIVPQIEMLQDVPISTTRRWQELFRRGESIIIEDVDALRDASPEEYEILAAQDITHLIVSPVWQGQSLVGFIGVDNPRKRAMDCGQVQTMALFLADRIQKDKTKGRLQELLNLHYEDVLKTTELGLWVIRLSRDNTRCEMYADQTMRDILGIRGTVTAEECYRHWYERISEGYFHYVNYSVKNMIETGHTVELCYTWNHPVKGPVTVRCLGTRVEDMGDMICLEGYHREINQVDRPNFLPDEKSIIFEFNENRRSVYFHNDRKPLAGSGERVEDFPACWLSQGMVHPHFARRFEAVFTGFQSQPELEGEEFLLKTQDGSYEWFKMKTRHLGDSRQDAGTMVVILDPARQERAMELEFQRQKDFYHAILAEKISYAEIDMESRRILTAGGLWSGYPSYEEDYEQILLRNMDRFVHPEDRGSYSRFVSEETLQEVMASQKDTAKLQLRRLIDGQMRWVELTGHVFQDRLTENVYALLYMQDIDARKRRELEQEIAATRDPLTGVYNRSAFQEEVTQHVLRSGSPWAGTLVILDLDNFKEINDTHGHAEGDRVLRQMADVLMSSFRRKDLIGRFGGDEFLVFLKDTTDQRVIERRIKEMRDNLETMNQHRCTCSVGIAPVSRDGFRYEDYLRYADSALYESKKRGKDTYSFYSDAFYD